MAGVLAIWHDLEDSRSELYERWLVGEHIPERLALPGFLGARRYEAVMGSPRFFIAYDVTAPEALASPEYLARLASPTPQTREVMAGFRNMLRTACSVAYRSPRRGLGACAVTAYSEDPVAVDGAGLERDPRVVGVQVWKAAQGPAGATSSEAKLRPGGDRRIETALVVDVQRENVGVELEDAVRAPLGRDAHVGTYRLLGEWRNES
ncbi:MAG TPA: hypothetical protein VMI74_02045 [Burkholderiales bacterium]|nr:hypothetical protein [Burkholderiales bacterium]